MSTVLFSSADDLITSEPVDDAVFNAIPEDIAPGSEDATFSSTFLDAPADKPDVKNKRASKLQTQLEGTYVTLGTAIFMFDSHTGSTVIQQAPACAKALDELAKTNPAVKRALDNAMATSAWGAVIAAHLPIIVMVATKHVPALKEKLVGEAEAQAQQSAM